MNRPSRPAGDHVVSRPEPVGTPSLHPPAGAAPGTARPEPERHSLLIPAALLALLIGSSLFYVFNQMPWLIPFFRDLAGWLRSPGISGLQGLPRSWFTTLWIFGLLLWIGHWLSRAALKHTPLAHSRMATTSLALVLGVAAFGYVGMLAVIAGSVSEPVVLAMTLGLALAPALGWAHRRVRHRGSRVSELDDGRYRSAPPPPLGHGLGRDTGPRGTDDTASPWLRRAVPVLVSVVVGLTLVHAALTPVTEWDSTTYHAATARLWFLERPSPPVIYGPSVGIEISANYPPLFPGSGLTMYVLGNSLDDFDMRILSPLLLLALIGLVYEFVRSTSGRRAALWTALLLATTPILLMYAVWPTAYMLLTDLSVVSVILCCYARLGRSRRTWVAAAMVAGGAILTQFFGLLMLGAAPLALLMVRPRSSRRPEHRWAWLGAFVAIGVVVAAPWLLRNEVLLGDPIYPLGAPIFHGVGLDNALWPASEAEVTNNALGLWAGTPHALLRAAELFTALFNNNLLITGALFGLAAALWLRRTRALTGFLAAGCLIYIGIQILPGWYWLRALLPVVPLVAILVAVGIVQMGRTLAWHAQEGGWRRGLHLGSRVTLVAMAASAAVVGLSLAFAGPNQVTWTTSLRGNVNLLRGTRDLGSTGAELWDTYRGDYWSWLWIDDHLRDGQRVATLDIRNYYIENPGAIFYLDGVEALPLLSRDTAGAAERFLAAQHVRYVLSPAWTVARGPAQDPSVRLLPLMRFLGDGDFPAVAAFPSPDAENPTMIYAVGGTSAVAVPTVYSGYSTQSPRYPEQGPFLIDAGATDPRIFVPVPPSGQEVLILPYRNTAKGLVSINYFDPARGTWDLGLSSFDRTGGGGWSSAYIPLPPSTTGYVDLGVHAEGSDLEIGQPSVRQLTEATVISASRTNPDGSWTILDGSVSGRIYVPVSSAHRTVLRFQYLDRGHGTVELNLQPAGKGPWSGSRYLLRLTGSGRWEAATVTLGRSRAGFVLVGPYPAGADLTIRDLSSSSAG